ncbi:MAG: hypothetical protein H7Y37_01965 [Anaerolineae bacterium]|nr:hypothetical protein [Gloeobacterales cyanobacterium ES-bin-313]
MNIDVRFSFVCPKQFSELEGEGELKRHCSACGLDVINLDVLNDEARLAVFETAAKSPIQVCVSATVPLENGRDCTTSVPAPPPLPPFLGRTIGRAVMPTQADLEAERQRIEAEKIAESIPDSPFARLIAKLKFW